MHTLTQYSYVLFYQTSRVCGMPRQQLAIKQNYYCMQLMLHLQIIIAACNYIVWNCLLERNIKFQVYSFFLIYNTLCMQRLHTSIQLVLILCVCPTESKLMHSVLVGLTQTQKNEMQPLLSLNILGLAVSAPMQLRCRIQVQLSNSSSGKPCSFKT